MVGINESLTAERNVDGSVDLNVRINQTMVISISLNPQDWRHLTRAFPVEGESMYDEARQAHEKYVQLPIEHQFQIGINVGVITDEDAKKGDAIKLHNGFLKAIFSDQANIEITNNFINEVDESWKQLHGDKK